MESTKTKKKQNIFVRYFTPFGIKQVCDIIMLAGFVLLITGLCTNNSVMLAAFICYLVGATGAIVLCCKILFTTKNRRAPSFKTAVINVSIMGVLFALALFGIIYTLVQVL